MLSLVSVRVKGGMSDCFRINSCGRQGCIMSPWLFNVYMDAVMKEVKWGWEEGREWRLSGLLYADDLVLCDELEEDLRAMVGCFVEVHRRSGLKVNAGKSKGMVLCGEGELKCKVCVGKMQFEHVSEFKYLGRW